jgi:hypothetical protein
MQRSEEIQEGGVDSRIAASRERAIVKNSQNSANNIVRCIAVVNIAEMNTSDESNRERSCGEKFILRHFAILISGKDPIRLDARWVTAFVVSLSLIEDRFLRPWK